MKTKTPSPQQYLYGGISGVKLDIDYFDLGEGVEIRRTFAHLFSSNMVAFAPPGPKGYHPGPWKAAKGGFSYDIEVEIRAPEYTNLGKSFDARETIWWIAALLRIAHYPFLSIHVISSRPFSEIPMSDAETTITPFETEGRIFGPADGSSGVLEIEQLAWVKDKWVEAGKLMNQNPKLYSALKSFDGATLRGRASSSLLAMWGAIEQIFAPSAGELHFRVAALMASYLEPQGTSRLELYKEILKLYNERSIAAHTAKEIETGPLVQTYVLMRNALIKMIDANQVPTQANLETLLFCGDSPIGKSPKP